MRVLETIVCSMSCMCAIDHSLALIYILRLSIGSGPACSGSAEPEQAQLRHAQAKALKQTLGHLDG